MEADENSVYAWYLVGDGRRRRMCIRDQESLLRVTSSEKTGKREEVVLTCALLVIILCAP